MASPTFGGIPLSLISLVTLTVQNSALTVVLHYSRISVPADRMYNAASAVLLNELLKGAISLSIAFRNAVYSAHHSNPALDKGEYGRLEVDEKGRRSSNVLPPSAGLGSSIWSTSTVTRGGRKMFSEVFSGDCWKLSIPACLYVIQNNLQFVAASNLDVPTFQVTYNLKILTTALFSVILLRRRLSAKKWFALMFLAAGVGVVQIQDSTSGSSSSSHGGHEMDKAKGLLAVLCACLTSGLAGVYFEMVLKGSKADLWIRNVQLSFFSLLPAVCAVFAPGLLAFGGATPKQSPTDGQAIFANFGGWAWSVVLIQVFGGLVTALVIRYSDNIMKGFATSLAIVLSFCAGIILFDFHITLSFIVGTGMVVTSTYLYNLPDGARGRSFAPEPATSLPSPSVSKGAFISPSSSYNSLNKAAGPSPYSSQSALSNLRNSTAGSSSASSTSPSLSLGGNTATPGGYRRPNPQYLPPGAQTPDHSTFSFGFDTSANDGAAAAHAAVAKHGGLPVVPGSPSMPAEESRSKSRSSSPFPPNGFSPQPPSSPKQSGGVRAGATLSPRSDAEEFDSFSSGRTAGSAPGSPEPEKRKSRQLYGSDGQPQRWS